MIMYDIIKNHNYIDLNDIITRQILLSNLSEKHLSDFLTGNRYEFLSKFYDKCENNECNTYSFNFSKNYMFCYNTSDTFQDDFLSLNKTDNFSCIKSNCNITTDDSYIKNTMVPKFLYVISENNMTNAEKTMIATLQGLTASRSEKQIYILSSSEPDYEMWLKD